MNTDIMKRETFTAIVGQVKKSQDDFSRAIDILETAQKELGLVLGDYRAHILEHGISKEKCLEKIKGSAWGYLLHRSGVFEFCSIRQRDEINSQMEDEKNLPEFTLDNIQAWFESYAVNIDKLFEDSIKEIFDWLRPWKYDDYRTNNREIIGRKVIKTGMFENIWNGRMSLVYHRDKYVQAMDNVFHLMDGKGVAKYPGNLVTAIKEACQHGQMSCETEYFIVKWYKKGTMHMEFKRLDLLDKVNAKAGGLNLGADLFGKQEAMVKVG
ncbi:MAG TPA: hypothetical protein DCZ94_08800 [Lentisphaeria bacterium]|nr:MAG: hypothetical protein A2X48_23600 [Lentisphaerae bacterium GWF2_49_21]HBC87038.1 hypothetical protein [Lentisphaeria bacterium]